MKRQTITAATWEAIKVAYAAGIGLREFARNAGIPEGTVLSYAKRKGLTQEIATAKIGQRPELARALAQPDAINAITPLQSVATTMVQRGQRHVERMAGVSEKIVGHVETMDPAEVLESIHEVEKFDRMARRTYGLSEQGGSGTLSLSVLTKDAAIRVSAAA